MGKISVNSIDQKKVIELIGRCIEEIWKIGEKSEKPTAVLSMSFNTITVANTLQLKKS